MDFYAARAITKHCYLTLARVNGEIDAELKAYRTLQNGQELQEVIVQERYLGVIDKWLNYIDKALEEADRGEFQQVHWAEHATVKIVERYNQETSYPLEENLYGDVYDPEPQFPKSHE